VEFELDKPGGELFAKLTRNNLRRLLAILLDGEIISAPKIHSEIHARAVIDGGVSGFTSQEIQYLVSTLNAGMLAGQLLHDPVSEAQAMVQIKPDPRLLAIFIFIAVVAIAN